MKEEKYSCRCVSKHVPLPMRLNPLIVNEDTVYLCGTAFDNLQELLQEYVRHGGEPPGAIRKHYSDYVQDIARRVVDRSNNPAV